MKIVASADWRDAVPFDTPVVVADVVAGEPAHCAICGGESEPLSRSELWAVKHRHPKHHGGFVRFYCAEHVPEIEQAPAPVAAAPAARKRAAAPRAERPAPARQVRTPAVRRVASVDEAPRAMCPDCYVEVSALGICGMCGSQVA